MIRVSRLSAPGAWVRNPSLLLPPPKKKERRAKNISTWYSRLPAAFPSNYVQVARSLLKKAERPSDRVAGLWTCGFPVEPTPPPKNNNKGKSSDP